jgi:aryl-alcohol dehydrogenase-like predicted oxidoreductase
VALVAATPLGRGLLTPTFQSGEAKADESDMRPKFMPQHKAENRDTNVAFVTQFKALAEKKNCSITQLALAFLLKQGDDVIPIPGTKKLKYLEENWKALDVNLTDEDEAEIRQFIKTTELAGSNMPGPFKDWEYRDTAEEA